MRAAYEDLKYALRVLRRSPRLTLPTLLMLALGVGACVAAFAVADAAIEPRLPYGHLSRMLAVLWTRTPASPLLTSQLVPLSDFDAVSGLASTFDRITYYAPWHTVVTGRFGAQEAEVAIVPPNFFVAIAVSPLLGRMPTAWSGAVGPPEAVVGYSFWREAFAGARSAIGQEIRVDQAVFAVAAVMPEAMVTGPQVWLPVGSAPGLASRPEASAAYICAWLRPGVAARSAQAALDLVSARLAATDPARRGWMLVALPYAGIWVDSKDRAALVLLLGAGALVLTASCLNVGALMLSRSLATAHEPAILVALGASPSRVARQLGIEGLCLGAVGAPLGLLGARWALWLARSVLVLWLPSLRGLPLGVDLTASLLGLCAGAAAGALAGLIPGTVLLRRIAAGQTGGPRFAHLWAWRPSRGASAVLVAGQMAAATSLVALSLLALRSYRRAAHADLGLVADDVVQIEVYLPRQLRAKTARQFIAVDRLRDALRSLPGVQEAAAAWQPVLAGAWAGGQALVETRRGARARGWGSVQVRYVTAGYFATLGVKPALGRTLATDPLNTSSEVLVNRAFVRQFAMGQQPLGKPVSVRAGSLGTLGGAVAGIVPDMSERSATLPPEPTVYTTVSGLPIPLRSFALLARPQPGHLVSPSALRQLVQRTDPGAATASARRLEDYVSDERAPFRLRSGALGGLGALVALVALAGVFSATRLQARMRAFEFAVRACLGATPADLLRLSLRRDLGAALVGLGLGTALALATGRFASAILFGVTPKDPVSLGASAVVLAFASGLASYVAARRSSRTEPCAALKSGV